MQKTYISEHSDAEFSHGIYPDCFDKKMKEIEEADTVIADKSYTLKLENRS